MEAGPPRLRLKLKHLVLVVVAMALVNWVASLTMGLAGKDDWVFALNLNITVFWFLVYGWVAYWLEEFIKYRKSPDATRLARFQSIVYIVCVHSPVNSLILINGFFRPGMWFLTLSTIGCSAVCLGILAIAAIRAAPRRRHAASRGNAGR